jgi:uncharacterized lipoprotein YmbA
MRWLCIALASCALTSKSAPVELRYFTPESPSLAVPRSSEPRAKLRIGRITASGNLRYAIVHRESAVELAPYETLRWTDTPETYLRRALSRALFESRPLDQAVGGAAATLDVELVAFEETEHHRGRVAMRYVLHDEQAVLARGEIAVERDASGPAIEPVVAAIGAALDAATAQLADRVAGELCPK